MLNSKTIERQIVFRVSLIEFQTLINEYLRINYL